MARVADDIDGYLRRLADGDRSAFDPLYDRLWPIVRAWCARRVTDPAQAEDAAQAALIKVFERASSYDPERPALPWVLTIASWECRTAQTNQRRRPTGEQAPDEADPGATPEDLAVRADLVAALREVMGELSPSDEETLWAAVHGAHGEVGGATFRKRLERARGRLRSLWGRRHGTS